MLNFEDGKEHVTAVTVQIWKRHVRAGKEISL